MRVRERTTELSKINEELAAEIAERKTAETRANLTNLLLELFATKTSRKKYLDLVVEAIREWSGCQCVGIRLTNEDGFIPYESCVGFNKEFLAIENMLSLERDACICLRVISEAPEPQDASLVTPKGSFRSNNTLQFIDGLSIKEKARYRDSCIRHGFASLAVIPVRYRGKVLGAVHIADREKNRMSAETVEFLENMAILIGEAVHRFDIEKELRESEERYRQNRVY